MKILIVASEAAPFLRTSDVANVVIELCSELKEQGHDARMVIPFYRHLAHAESAHQVVEGLDVRLGDYTLKAGIWRVDHTFKKRNTITLYLVRNEFHFGRDNPYGYLDDYERFIFFSRAALEMVDDPQWAKSEEAWYPDVIHGHDWVAGLIPFWLRNGAAGNGKGPIAFVYTLHNAGFAGQFGRRALHVAGLEKNGIYEALGETANKISFMARGIWAADAVNTVSPTHAAELTSGNYASSLTQAITLRNGSLRGILNGIDQKVYNPAFDKHVVHHFDPVTLPERRQNKVELQFDPELPLIGMVSRLIAEKGLGLVEQGMQKLLEEGAVQFVCLGAPGDFRYQEALARMAQKFPDRMKAFFGFDDGQARRIFAASDIILIPSLYEPCGLQQMIAMRYGAIPIVTKTGGLADTVANWDEPTAVGRGFVCRAFTADELVRVVRSALDLLKSDPRMWEELQAHNMKREFSWTHSAQKYVELYQEACAAAQQRPALSDGATLDPEPTQLLVHAILQVNDLATAADTRDYLRQAARIVRGLLHSDGVLIWTEDESAPHLLRLKGSSFAENHRPHLNPLPESVQADLGVRSWSPQYIFRRQPGSNGLQFQAGFLASNIATELDWQVQVSIPMNTRGATGRIDVFFCDPKRVVKEEDVSSLSAVAGVLARNLEQIGEREFCRQLQAADRDMAAATTVTEVARIALEYAEKLAYGNGAELSIRKSPSQVFVLDGHDFVILGQDAGGEGVHPSELRKELRFEGEKEHGYLKVWRKRIGGFSSRDDLAVQALARQAAAALQATYRREVTERTRVEEQKTLSNNLAKLSGALAGSQDSNTLMKSVVETIGSVLGVEAASLYLADAERRTLMIQAAFGYQEPLVDAKASYLWGEGVTGRIAESNEEIGANSLAELRKHGAGKPGKYDHLHKGGKVPLSFYALPLNVKGQDKPIGVLKVESVSDRRFSTHDVQLLRMMANVIATVVYNSKLGEERLAELSDNLSKLSSALAGSQDSSTLMDNIVKTIGPVLNVQAASLYLADENRQSLTIQAAFGYQEPLIEAKASYEWGEGVTGRIAETNKDFGANSLEELRRHGSGKPGKFDHLHIGGKVPRSFYALPLNVRGQEKPIGVLKVESEYDRGFTTQDVQLLRMMANVIATVVYNSKLGEQRLEKLSQNLGRLSGALAGSQDRRTLMDNIVETIGTVLGVDAASLYLADENRQVLTIQAAFGYQEPLVAAKASYLWGQGVTGRIAETNKDFGANSLDELRTHGSGRPGKFDHLHLGGKVPRSFYALPLNVLGQDKPIGVLKVESVHDRKFTSQDVQLLRMMANVIATVVYNTQLDRARLASIVSALGSITNPSAAAALKLLRDFCRTTDQGTLDLLGGALASNLSNDPDNALKEATALLAMKANSDLYRHIADASTDPSVRRRFNLFYRAAKSEEIEAAKLGRVFDLTDRWVSLEERQESVEIKIVELVEALSTECRAKIVMQENLGQWIAFLLETKESFGENYLPDKLPLAVHRTGEPDEVDLKDLRELLKQKFGRINSVLLPLVCPPDHLDEVRSTLRSRIKQPFAIDTVIFDVETFQRIVGATRPASALQRAFLAQADLVLVSPYQTVAHVDGHVFFGRESELRTICERASRSSFAIVGGRRIGKTSILRQLHTHRLGELNPPVRSIYQNCLTIHRKKDLLACAITDWRPGPPPSAPTTFNDLFHNTQYDRPIVLLLDEVDALIENDPKEVVRLFTQLRALQKEGVFQVVVTGERALLEGLKDDNSALFNFMGAIVLGPLEYRAVQQLIVGPMRNLGIKLIGDVEIVQRIFDFTSGHPNVVQRVCARLVETVNQQEGERAIRIADVEKILRDPTFQEGDFLGTFLERTSPLEKIITLLLVRHNAPCRFLEVLEMLRKNVPGQVDPSIAKNALESLVKLRRILRRHDDAFEFAVSAFPTLLQDAGVVGDQLAIEMEKFRKTAK